MTELNEIETLVQQELAEANEIHPQFASDHEAWAVLKEEIEECGDEFIALSAECDAMWQKIRQDEDCQVELKLMKHRAICTIQEAIQIAAMCEKGLARYGKEL